jgi:hypothetical protein
MAGKSSETLVKKMVLRTAICFSISLFTLAACTSGPVPVRDTVTTPVSGSSIPAAQDKSGIQPGDQLNKIGPSVIKPPSAPVPLSSELKQQAEQSLQYHRWQQAILFAEHGLRINRKEPFFYWVLSTAYQKLSKMEQSIDFARQGLRYVYGDSELKSQLMSLAAQ